MVETTFDNSVDDLVRFHDVAFGVPAGVGRVTPSTAEVTAGEADESRWDSGKETLALNRVEDLGDLNLQIFSPGGL